MSVTIYKERNHTFISSALYAVWPDRCGNLINLSLWLNHAVRKYTELFCFYGKGQGQFVCKGSF